MGGRGEWCGFAWVCAVALLGGMSCGDVGAASKATWQRYDEVKLDPFSDRVTRVVGYIWAETGSVS